MLLKKPFQRRRRLYPDIRGSAYSFLLIEYFNTLFDKTCQGGLVLEVHFGLREVIKLIFP
jgi:hypothetical protein